MNRKCLHSPFVVVDHTFHERRVTLLVSDIHVNCRPFEERIDNVLMRVDTSKVQGCLSF